MEQEMKNISSLAGHTALGVGCGDSIRSSQTSRSSKTPKLIYCGDGVVEEYSSDDEEDEEEIRKKEAEKISIPPVDPVRNFLSFLTSELFEFCIYRNQ